MLQDSQDEKIIPSPPKQEVYLNKPEIKNTSKGHQGASEREVAGSRQENKENNV